MKWDKQVPGCFGGGFFAGHPSDEQRAFDWLIDLRHRGVGWQQVRSQLKAYLDLECADTSHAETQLAEAESKLKPWLLSD